MILKPTQSSFLGRIFHQKRERIRKSKGVDLVAAQVRKILTEENQGLILSVRG